MSGKLGRYFHTVKYLRPLQLARQLAKPFLMKAPLASAYFAGVLNPIRTIILSLDLNTDYLARFDPSALMRDEITLLHETYVLNLQTWRVDASPLWRFNLHYFEYAISLGAVYQSSRDIAYYRKFKELLRSWIAANPSGVGDGWHPYTISMRIPNWFICFDLFGSAFEQDKEFQTEVLQSVYAQYQTLLKRKETWQLGNHYFENLKTIVFCSLLFRENKVLEKHLRLFLREIGEEVLPDGVHFELSPMYHKIILEDLLRVAHWLQQAKRSEVDALIPAIQKMTSALASLEYGMGKTPLFNDSGDGVAKETTSLLCAANELFGIKPDINDSFTDSGYYKLYDENIALMFDAGRIGPNYMPGHGHCDCLSVEVSIDGRPLFVNSGTYQYQGEMRKYFRSTAAHNTLMAEDREQSECWGEHRVARRIKNVKAEKRGQLITGSYRSYLGDTHTRMISLKERVLTVLDSFLTTAPCTVYSYLHIADNYELLIDGEDIKVILDDHIVSTITPVKAKYRVHTSGNLTNYSPSFGLLLHASCIEFQWQSDDKQHGYIIQFY